ncbi:MAG: DNA repair protein RecO [Pseudomonadota bacterium]|jgi:DNA repair protein RecO|nr:MAG: DNA repair protein RecO [Pseudomonadota bacterium]
MIRNPRRIQLAPGYILHHRPYRDTSRILEVLTRDHGRLSLFARGVRGPKSKLAPVLQPFRLLLLSWSGRGEAPQLTGAELAGDPTPLPSASLMAGFYLNELILKLTTRHDPSPAAFDAYHAALESLKAHAGLEPTLRIFEKRLLEALGYGLDLTSETRTGRRIDPEAHYHYRPSQGLFLTVADAPGALSGRSLLALANEELGDERELEDSKRLLQSVLAEVLEGRELATRAVARAIARRESRT